MSKGKVILIPCTLGDVNPLEVLPKSNTDFINSCDVFIVENLRSARRFLKKIGLQKAIDDLQFFEINKRTKKEDIPSYLSGLCEKKNIGVISEAGCPGVADPGAEVVKWAHKKYAGHSFNRSIFYPTSFDGFRNERTEFCFYRIFTKRKS